MATNSQQASAVINKPANAVKVTGTGATTVQNGTSNLPQIPSSGSSGGSFGGSTGSAINDAYNYGRTASGAPAGGYSSGGSSGSSSTPQSKTPASDQQIYDESQNPKPYTLPTPPDATPQKVEQVDVETLKGMLQQIVDSQKEQSQSKIDYGVQQGVNELNRAVEDAAKQYQEERNQASADEARALDNQALYAEARGDRGGIGAAQYAEIQNTAAKNRQAVNEAQTKLSTDTARQIADLRSQGEFEKADQLLTITQNYLSQLMALEQWAIQTNLSVDEFNTQLQQWLDEYNMNSYRYQVDTALSAAQLTGYFADGTRTLAAQNALTNSLMNSGNALLSAGIMPTKQQLSAMGMTEAQAQLYLAQMGY